MEQYTGGTARIIKWEKDQESSHGLTVQSMLGSGKTTKLMEMDGDVYEGNWENDRANGYGTYIHANGSKYLGFWKNDLQHG